MLPAHAARLHFYTGHTKEEVWRVAVRCGDNRRFLFHSNTVHLPPVGWAKPGPARGVAGLPGAWGSEPRVAPPAPGCAPLNLNLTAGILMHACQAPKRAVHTGLLRPKPRGSRVQTPGARHTLFHNAFPRAPPAGQPRKIQIFPSTHHKLPRVDLSGGFGLGHPGTENPVLLCASTRIRVASAPSAPDLETKRSLPPRSKNPFV